MDKEALQQAFDKAYLGLKAQGFERSHENEVCLYRGPDGKKCALGHLIPDDQYRHDMEGRGVGWILRNFPEALPLELHNDRTMRDLRRLQQCHDLSGSPEAMKARLHQYAEVHGLTVPE